MKFTDRRWFCPNDFHESNFPAAARVLTHEWNEWSLLSVSAEQRKGNPVMARYGKTAQKKVKRAMHERKRGTLRSGRSGKKVTSRKQAIAIGLSEARRAGAKVPRKKRRRSR